MPVGRRMPPLAACRNLPASVNVSRGRDIRASSSHGPRAGRPGPRTAARNWSCGSERRPSEENGHWRTVPAVDRGFEFRTLARRNQPRVRCGGSLGEREEIVAAGTAASDVEPRRRSGGCACGPECRHLRRSRRTPAFTLPQVTRRAQVLSQRGRAPPPPCSISRRKVDARQTCLHQVDHAASCGDRGPGQSISSPAVVNDGGRSGRPPWRGLQGPSQAPRPSPSFVVSKTA